MPQRPAAPANTMGSLIPFALTRVAMHWLVVAVIGLAVLAVVLHNQNRPDPLDARYQAMIGDVRSALEDLRTAKTSTARAHALVDLIEAGTAADRLAVEANAAGRDCLASAAGFTASWVDRFRFSRMLGREPTPEDIANDLAFVEGETSRLLACTPTQAGQTNQ